VELVDRLPDDDETAGSPVSSDAAAPELEEDQPPFNPMTCARCEQELDYVGTRRFHEGTNWGVLGEVGEFFVKREAFDIYVCPNCGRVEFFVNGIGEEFRPH
jgi:hypothetical protein